MKATKNLNGAARVAVQAKLDALEKELRCAKMHSEQYKAELGRVRALVSRYTTENDDLNRQIKWVGESCRQHLDTIQALEAKQVDHDEVVEKLELELDIAEEQIQYHKEAARRWRIAAWVVLGGYAAAVPLLVGTL